MISSNNRVLVVEDDATSRQYLEIALIKQGYQVNVAEDAADAQEQLNSENISTFSCVVTDYRMPNRNGLELLAWIKEQDPSLSTILVTAEGEKHLVAESLRGGAIDFLDKPVDLRKLHGAVARAVEQTVQHRHMADSESAVKELGRAQLRMLGVDDLQGPGRVDMCFYPKHEAGGDFLSRFQLDSDRLFCLLTDVSGHDLQAAYISAYFQGVVRGMLARGAAAQDIFPDFNRFLLEEWNQTKALQKKQAPIDASVAACAILVNFAKQTATVFTQGTPAPVYFQRDGDALVVGRTGGFPLGWFANLTPEGVSHSIADGGSFLLWTDGLEDLAEKQGITALSLAYALQEAKKRNHELPCIATAKDDILLATIHLSSPDENENGFRPLLCEHHHGGQSREIDTFQSLWQRSLNFAVPELPNERLHDILLASREALLNALNHGCGGRADHHATFQISYCSQRQTIRVRAVDSGPGHNFNLAQHEERAATELIEEHRGLILITRLATAVVFHRNGASVIMDFHWQ